MYTSYKIQEEIKYKKEKYQVIKRQIMCILQNSNKRRRYYSLANEVAKGYSNATVRPSVTSL